MKHLIYISQAKQLFSADELQVLLANAQKNNASIDVTGCLLYAQGNFIQLLEGEDSKVNEVFDKITRDPRHWKIKIILAEPCESHSFENWWMAFFNLESAVDIPTALKEKLYQDGHELQQDPLKVHELFAEFRNYLAAPKNLE